MGTPGTELASCASEEIHRLGGALTRSAAVGDSDGDWAATAVVELTVRSRKRNPSAAASFGAMTLPAAPYVADTVTTPDRMVQIIAPSRRPSRRTAADAQRPSRQTSGQG